jgi:hypothetical protein
MIVTRLQDKFKTQKTIISYILVYQPVKFEMKNPTFSFTLVLRYLTKDIPDLYEKNYKSVMKETEKLHRYFMFMDRKSVLSKCQSFSFFLSCVCVCVCGTGD